MKLFRSQIFDWFMEKQFNKGEFEKLLRDNANQYRKYPSDKVWKGIHSSLHSRRRWYTASAILMFLITGTIVSVFIFNNKSGNIQQGNLKSVDITALRGQKANTVATSLENNASDKEISQRTNDQIDNNQFKYTYKPGIPVLSVLSQLPEKVDLSELNPEPSIRETESLNRNISPDLIKDETPSQLLAESINEKQPTIETGSRDFKSNQVINESSSLDENSENKITSEILALASQNAPDIRTVKPSRITAQFYFTPTVSYRKLSENKNSYGYGAFNNIRLVDINNVVKHKPAMGLEFGIEGKYRVTNNLLLKSGFQFNINRYDIRAYSHPTEIATVAVNSGYRTDSVAALSNYRNFSGYEPDWLENFYFQIGFPIGAEFVISENKNFSWGLSGTLQPTYILGDRAYLISSDYKNYAKFPELTRRWNISSGIGTFVSYSTGRIKWQAGPHVRYQYLSSFVSGYPVKENLFSVGLKIGATIQKK